MMYVWSCGRREFLDYMRDQRPLDKAAARVEESISRYLPLRKDMLLVWPYSPSVAFSLPHAVVVAPDGTQDFLAWVSTYLRHLRPFTAHSRVLTTSVFDELPDPAASAGMGQRLGLVELGLVLAEGLVSPGMPDPDSCTLSTFARTLSFACGQWANHYRALLRGSRIGIEEIRRAWVAARGMSERREPGPWPLSIAAVWSLVLGADAGRAPSTLVDARSEALLIDALRSVQESGNISNSLLTEFEFRIKGAESVDAVLRGPREARVEFVQGAVRDLSIGSSQTQRLRSFMAGFLTSRIHPGHLDHERVLLPLFGSLPESILWYGAFAGMASESRVDQFGDGLGWAIRRELERRASWLDRPNCDVALSELEILLKGQDQRVRGLWSLTDGTLKVEIVPLVSTYLKWEPGGSSTSARSDEPPGPSGALFGDDSQTLEDVQELIRKLDGVSESLDSIRRRLRMRSSAKTPRGRKR